MTFFFCLGTNLALCSGFLLIHVFLNWIGFLPSSFSMYAISLSSGLLLFEKYAMAVAVSVVGVILGWPFSILAFLPVVIYSLVKRFKQAFISGAVTSIFLLVSLQQSLVLSLSGLYGNYCMLLTFIPIYNFKLLFFYS